MNGFIRQLEMVAYMNRLVILIQKLVPLDLQGVRNILVNVLVFFLFDKLVTFGDRKVENPQLNIRN